MLHRSSLSSAAHTIADKHQRHLVSMEFFIAWSQLCIHMKWHNALQLANEPKRHIEWMSKRWEHASYVLARSQTDRLACAALFCNWLQALQMPRNDREERVTSRDLSANRYMTEPMDGVRQVQIRTHVARVATNAGSRLATPLKTQLTPRQASARGSSGSSLYAHE